LAALKTMATEHGCPGDSDFSKDFYALAMNSSGSISGPDRELLAHCQPAALNPLDTALGKKVARASTGPFSAAVSLVLVSTDTSTALEPIANSPSDVRLARKFIQTLDHWFADHAATIAQLDRDLPSSVRRPCAFLFADLTTFANLGTEPVLLESGDYIPVFSPLEANKLRNLIGQLRENKYFKEDRFAEYTSDIKRHFVPRIEETTLDEMIGACKTESGVVAAYYRDTKAPEKAEAATQTYREYEDFFRLLARKHTESWHRAPAPVGDR